VCDPTAPDTYVMEGHNIIADTIATLIANNGLSSASELILSGCSAGGLGVFENTDFVASLLPSVAVVGNPQAGYFGSQFITFAKFVELGAGEQPWLCSTGQDCLASVAALDDAGGSEISWRVNMSQYEPPAETACKIANGETVLPSGLSVCGAVTQYYPYTTSPMFVSEMTTDGIHLGAMGGLTGGAKSSAQGEEYIKYLSFILGSSLTENIISGEKQGDGLWAPACVDHCMSWLHGSRLVGGLSHYEVFGNWYFNGSRGDRPARTGSTQVIGDWSAAANGTKTRLCEDTVASARIVVSTPLGRLEGVSAGAVDTFKGIPFAEAPVGTLRFASAAPKARWSGTRDASSFGNVCLQGSRASHLHGDENCLFLNVYRKTGTTARSNLPVMLWANTHAIYQLCLMCRLSLKYCLWVSYRFTADHSSPEQVHGTTAQFLPGTRASSSSPSTTG
jgi:hypothetical protein